MRPEVPLGAAAAHGKINLHLGVGDARDDGYHELVTVFQAIDARDVVSLWEEWDYNEAYPGSKVIDVATELNVPGAYDAVPADHSNLAWQAIDLVVDNYRERLGERDLPWIQVEVTKNIPIAGGMAGGSADGAAALLAADDWLSRVYGVPPLGKNGLFGMAAELGSDVPFTLMGGAALGTGRGDQLTTMLSRGSYEWAVVMNDNGLSTPKVFSKLDELRAKREKLVPSLDTHGVASAMAAGDVERLGGALHNDLQAAALSLRPGLRKILDAGVAAGAIKGIVSGSGPTCVFLCEDIIAARQVLVQVITEIPGTTGTTVSGPVPGAEVLDRTEF